MENVTKIWLDGKQVSWQQATVHVMTHTLHYGSGAFEGIRCYKTAHGPVIFRLSDHVDRLVHSFSCFGVPVPWSKETIAQGIIDIIRANNLESCYIRPILFFGAESLLLSPKKLSVHCAIITLPMDKYLGKEAIKVGISSIKRIQKESLPIHRKINGFYVNSILAFHEAQARGFDEALLLDHANNVAEGSVANIFFVIDGILRTPPTTDIFPGITRSSILAIAQKLRIATEEKVVTKQDINKATEAFFTGTASEITPIHSIDQKTFICGPETITHKIKTAYENIVMGKNDDFKNWLTHLEK